MRSLCEGEIKVRRPRAVVQGPSHTVDCGAASKDDREETEESWTGVARAR
jgi:hypothetical protein